MIPVQAKQFNDLLFSLNHNLSSILPCCEQALHSLSDLSTEDRISILTDLYISLESLDKSSKVQKVSKLVKSALNKERRVQRQIDVKITNMRDYFVKEMVDSESVIIDYAILDSRLELPGSLDGLSEGTAIQFFITMLHFFDPQNSMLEVRHLKYALDLLFELWVYQEDNRYPRNDRLESPEQLFKAKVSRELLHLQNGMPYFFIPLPSKYHSMIGKVTWVYGEGYRLTVINTGDGAQFHLKNRCSDCVFLALSFHEVLTAIMANFKLSRRTIQVYKNIEDALPLEKSARCKGREHGLNKRSSCSIKALSSAFHDVLPERIYRSFKAYYTHRMVEDIEPGIRYEVACEVLEKRKNKALVN